jgi:hypothetical protein
MVSVPKAIAPVSKILKSWGRENLFANNFVAEFLSRSAATGHFFNIRSFAGVLYLNPPLKCAEVYCLRHEHALLVVNKPLPLKAKQGAAETVLIISLRGLSESGRAFPGRRVTVGRDLQLNGKDSSRLVRKSGTVARRRRAGPPRPWARAATGARQAVSAWSPSRPVGRRPHCTAASVTRKLEVELQLKLKSRR